MAERDLKFQRYWRFPAVLCAGLAFMPAGTAAQNVVDCGAAIDHLRDVVDQANYCRQAQDCDSVKLRESRSVGCGLLFNKAEQSLVESAIATYERYCTPHWHCLAWAATHRVECIQSKCKWMPASNPSLEKLEK